jgi:hypothetical protein
VPADTWTWLDRAYWAACGSAGIAILVASFLPAIEVGREASFEARGRTVSVVVHRVITLATYGSPWTFVYFVFAALLLAVSARALLRGGSPFLSLAPLIVVIVGLFNGLVVEGHTWGSHGMFGCNDVGGASCAGDFLQPAIDDLDHKLVRTYGGRPEFQLEQSAYAAWPRAGWDLLLVALWTLAPLAVFRVFRYRWRARQAFILSAAAILLALLLLFLAGLSNLE